MSRTAYRPGGHEHTHARPAARGGPRHEPVEKRVRADDVVDSTRAVLVWEPRRVTPLYAVPAADIAAPVAPGGEAIAVPDGVLHPGIPFAAHTARASR